MKRYRLQDNYDPAMGYGPAAMAEDDAGEWVRHDDMFVFTINEQEQTIGMRGEAYRLLADMAYQYAVDCGMANYLETRIEIRGASGEPAQQWVMTMQRCEGRTPHELRLEAEAELERLRALVRGATDDKRMDAVLYVDPRLRGDIRMRKWLHDLASPDGMPEGCEFHFSAYDMSKFFGDKNDGQ